MDAELVGRERELATLDALVRREDVRLVTITGPGGVGKTRLAQRLADQCWDRFALSAWVELAPVRQTSLVTSAIAAALGIPEPQRSSARTRLDELLGTRPCLLVLDNFEHLPEAAPVLGELLAAAPRLKIVVTSRLRLRMSPEHEFALGPLPPAQALALFVRRVQALQPDFLPTPERLPALSSICERLDGLPLALRLAAARMKLLPPDVLAERLVHRLPLLVGGPVDVPARQQTLRAALDWSFDLLPAVERGLFVRLSVFGGGADLAAVESVATDAGRPVDDALEHLMDHSLVQRDGERFSMLETVREYAAEHLARSGEAEEVRRRHVAHFLALAETANAQLNGPDQRSWLRRLDTEQHNFRMAMLYCVEHAWFEPALRLGRALGLYWAVRGQNVEGLQHLEAALRAGPPADPLLHADVLYRIGSLAAALGDRAKAVSTLNQAAEAYARLDHAFGVSQALRNLADLTSMDADWAASTALLERSLHEARRCGDGVAELRALDGFGVMKWREGDPVPAAEWFRQSEEISRRIGALRLLAHTLISRGGLAVVLGDETLAVQCLDEAIELCSQLELHLLVPLALHNRADIELRHGRWDRAGPMFQRCAREAARAEGLNGVALHLDGLAIVLSHTGHDALAVRTIASVDALRERTGDRVWPSNVAERQAAIERLQTRMPQATFELLRTQGRLQPLAELLEEVDRVRFDTPAARAIEATAQGPKLTRREVEVLQLLACSFSDRRIGETLRISSGTASKHVANLLGKSGQSNRTALMRWAVERGLVRVGAGDHTSDSRPAK